MIELSFLSEPDTSKDEISKPDKGNSSSDDSDSSSESETSPSKAGADVKSKNVDDNSPSSDSDSKTSNASSSKNGAQDTNDQQTTLNSDASDSQTCTPNVTRRNIRDECPFFSGDPAQGTHQSRRTTSRYTRHILPTKHRITMGRQMGRIPRTTTSQVQQESNGLSQQVLRNQQRRTKPARDDAARNPATRARQSEAPIHVRPASRGDGDGSTASMVLSARVREANIYIHFAYVWLSGGDE